MRRQVCWVERLEDGVKREIRVTFESGSRLKWQFKRSDREAWDYATPPSDADWTELAARMENRYFRRNVPLKDLELVRTLQAKARQA